jgi:sugar phosphate isomerase/epimerase
MGRDDAGDVLMERAPNTHAIHALDSFFYTSMGVYAFESQCEMLAELGYDGITVSAWGGTPSTDLSQLPAVRARHGLEVPLIELAVQTSLNGRGAILDFIASILPVAERRGLRIALYPHLRHVTQTTSEVVSLCEHFDHPLLGASFNGYHWYASQEGQLDQCLAAMRPWLMQVVLSGSVLSPLGWGGVATMEPLDCGELDNVAVLAALERVGYTGSLGILGWDYCGDVYSKLQRCLSTLRGMDQRLQRQLARRVA